MGTLKDSEERGKPSYPSGGGGVSSGLQGRGRWQWSAPSPEEHLITVIVRIARVG